MVDLISGKMYDNNDQWRILDENSTGILKRLIKQGFSHLFGYASVNQEQCVVVF